MFHHTCQTELFTIAFHAIKLKHPNKQGIPFVYRIFSINFKHVIIRNDIASSYYKKRMSRHTNNPDCSVTVVKLAGYNGDDYFLLPMLKGAFLIEFNT